MSESSVLVNTLGNNLDPLSSSNLNQLNLNSEQQSQHQPYQNDQSRRQAPNNRNYNGRVNRNHHYNNNYSNYQNQNYQSYQNFQQNQAPYYNNNETYNNNANGRNDRYFNDQYNDSNNFNNNNVNANNYSNNRSYYKPNRNERNYQTNRNETQFEPSESDRSNNENRQIRNSNKERTNRNNVNNNNINNNSTCNQRPSSSNQQQQQQQQSSSANKIQPNRKKNSLTNKNNVNNNVPSSADSTKLSNVKVTNITKPDPKQNQTRSEILIDQLKKHKCECMVCYSIIRNDKPIWSCSCCFHLFHLNCIKKWANSPSAKIDENLDKWRCPGCQTIFDTVPNKYTCFCTKKLNPEHDNRPYQMKQLPHSCGEVCSKYLSLSSKFWSTSQQQAKSAECKHKCLDICHPGPCAPCEALVTRSCNCGKAKFQVKCSSTKVPICDKQCDKLLNCNLHVCDTVCHSGDCKPCDVDVELTCFSHLNTKQVKCGSNEFNSSKSLNFYFNCTKKCDKLLSCKNHNCSDQCHPGECKPCSLMPSKLTHCPCGQTQCRELLIKNKIIRTSCLDSVPTCEKICTKILPCNAGLDNEQEIHTCESKCHLNSCPPCDKLVNVKCRCGKESDMIKCCEKNDIKLCDRRCQKKKTCSRHQCNEICCDDKDHICMQICNKQLGCGMHKCEELCHKGSCKRCLIASFEERICECGSTIQYPPIRCGTKPLDCPKLCSRAHSCDHPVTHNCHWEDKCPPCSFLTSKMCMGNHELRHNIPCHMKDVSCGKSCGKQLLNCSHKCSKTCHKDLCLDLDNKEVCTQPCSKERPHCSHACNSACHADTPCPDTICNELIVVKCKCGLKTRQLKCGQKMYGESAVVFENLASQLKEMLSCRSIDVSTFKSQEMLKKKHELECDEDCLLAERSRNLAQALQIEASARPKPIYSDFLKNFAREDPAFAANIENKFERVVNECKFSKTKKALNLPIMKPLERKFIHELAVYYEIETQSHDPEPNRNVALYASKEKCHLPSVLLTQSIDLKTTKSTMPRLAIKQLNQRTLNPIQSNLKVLQSENEPISVSGAFSALADEQDDELESRNKEQRDKTKGDDKVIDYFDLTD